jgi:hypothetical protein
MHDTEAREISISVCVKAIVTANWGEGQWESRSFSYQYALTQR